MPAVFVDGDYHVMYKEYNLRRSKTFLTTIKPAKKEEGEGEKERENEAASSEQTMRNDKRQRPAEEPSEEQAAKRLKADEGLPIAHPITTTAAEESPTKAAEEKRSESPAKTSPAKRSRKPSLSQSKALRKKKQASQVGGSRGGGGGGAGMESVVCCLCSRRDSSSNLGFLYGPYRPVTYDEEKGVAQEVVAAEEGGGEGGGGGGGGPVDQTAWVHEECAVWAPGVCLVRGKLLGLHEAVADGKKLVSIVCGMTRVT